MSKPIYRLTQPGDERALREIWSAAYDGDTACADVYFDRCYRPGDGVVAEVDGALCSAIYLLDGYTLHANSRRYSCSYLYALGTPEQPRGCGYGGRTIWRSGVEGYLRGNDFVCFVPASESLRRWYQNILGTRSVFFHRCITLDAPAPVTGCVSPIAPEDYLRQREAFLTGRPHIEAPEKAFKLQQTYCELYGGGLWQFELNGAPGICLGDREDGKLTLRELLFPDGDAAEAGQMMMQTLGCTSAEVRTPAFWHDGQGELREDCILVPGGGKFPETFELPFWGFAMD